jgi:hypothetical protein
MVKLLRHRQTKGAATDMFYLTPPRHISTLPISTEMGSPHDVGFTILSDRIADIAGGRFGAKPGSRETIQLPGPRLPKAPEES